MLTPEESLRTVHRRQKEKKIKAQTEEKEQTLERDEEPKERAKIKNTKYLEDLI